jgi:hypothetical protein
MAVESGPRRNNHNSGNCRPGNSEPSELIYFKVYKSQIPVLEQALETAARMLGSDKSRGYCLEMICADFLAGANLENGSVRARVCLTEADDFIDGDNVWSAARLQEKFLGRIAVCVNVSGLVGESISGHWMRSARPCPD